MVVDFKIVPQGFHPLLLGMSGHQVDEVMGARPAPQRSLIAGEEVYWYERAYARVTMRDDRVVEIGLCPPARVLFDGKPLFTDPTVWRALVSADADPQECVGFLVLRSLRITLTGFHDRDKAQLAITAFEPGRWDHEDLELKPFRPNPRAR